MNINQTIKICFIIDTIDSPTGGTEKQLLMLLEHLDRKKFSPYLIALRSSDWLEQGYKGAPYHCLNITSMGTSFFRGVLNLANYLRKNSVDVVQTFFNEGNRVGIIAGWLAGVTILISSRRNQGFGFNRLTILILKMLNTCVDSYIANSFSTKEWAQKVEGITPDKIEVIYNGVNLKMFCQKGDGTREKYRKELGIPDDAFVIGIVANLREVKGHEFFLNAAHIISKQISKAHFLIVGDGDQENVLRNITERLGIADHVNFLGRRFDIPKILSAFDIGVLSSKSESFPNALVEYLAAFLPIVSSDVGGAREAIEDGCNGYVVPVGDATALADRILDIIAFNRFETMGKASRERAELLFSQSGMIKRHEDFYAYLLNRAQKIGQC